MGYVQVSGAERLPMAVSLPQGLSSLRCSLLT